MSPRRTTNPVSLFSFQDIITSVVGVMLLIILILLLQLISRMFAAPPSPTLTEQEIRQQIDSIQPVLTELQDSIVELRHARDRSELQTPSQEQIDAIRSTIETLETDVAETEKKIELIQKRIADLRNDPAGRQLSETQQEVEKLKREIAGLKPHAGQPGVQMKIVAPKNADKRAFIVDYSSGGVTVIPADGMPKQTFSSATQFNNWVSGRDPKKEQYVVYVRPSQFGEHNRSGRHNSIVTNLRDKGFDVGFQVIGARTNLTLND